MPQPQLFCLFNVCLAVSNMPHSTPTTLTQCQVSQMSEYDSVNRNVLNRVRNVARDGADVTSGGKQFHTLRASN